MVFWRIPFSSIRCMHIGSGVWAQICGYRLVGGSWPDVPRILGQFHDELHAALLRLRDFEKWTFFGSGCTCTSLHIPTKFRFDARNQVINQKVRSRKSPWPYHTVPGFCPFRIFHNMIFINSRRADGYSTQILDNDQKDRIDKNHYASFSHFSAHIMYIFLLHTVAVIVGHLPPSYMACCWCRLFTRVVAFNSFAYYQVHMDDDVDYATVVPDLLQFFEEKPEHAPSVVRIIKSLITDPQTIQSSKKKRRRSLSSSSGFESPINSGPSYMSKNRNSGGRKRRKLSTQMKRAMRSTDQHKRLLECCFKAVAPLLQLHDVMRTNRSYASKTRLDR